MKRVILGIVVLLLNIIYLPFKIFPRKNRITFISRQSDKPTVDFILLENEIKTLIRNYDNESIGQAELKNRNSTNKIETVMLCKKINNGICGKISYGFHIFAQMKSIAQSKVVIIDGYCITISVLKHKKGLEVVQIWHALGAIKKFGYSVIGKKEGSSEAMAKGMKMHKNYTRVYVSSEYVKDDFAKAYNVSRDILKVNPLPIVDLLRDSNYKSEKQECIFEKYPELKGTERLNVVYAPTFRTEESDFSPIYNLANAIEKSKYNLIIKVHPLVDFSDQIKGVIVDKEFSTQDMMMLADCMISDYSAIAFDGAIMDIPMGYYVYDFERYTKNRDFNIDYMNEMPGMIFKDPKDINKAIEDSDSVKFSDMRRGFLKKYISLTEEKQATRIANDILGLIGFLTE